MTSDDLKAIRKRASDRARLLDELTCCGPSGADPWALLQAAHADVTALLGALDEHAPPNADLVTWLEDLKARGVLERPAKLTISTPGRMPGDPPLVREVHWRAG